MNSKLLFLLCFLFCSCGVKNPPIAPEGSSLPSYVDSFLDKPEATSQKNKKLEQKNRDSSSSEDVSPTP